jgi:outer membrane lipoprotein-sorting protein
VGAGETGENDMTAFSIFHFRFSIERKTARGVSALFVAAVCVAAMACMSWAGEPAAVTTTSEAAATAKTEATAPTTTAATGLTKTEAAVVKVEPAKTEATGTAAPEVVAVLDRMDAAGKDFKTIRAKFNYELNQTLYEDIQKRKGELLYQAPNLLRFEFTDKPQETFVFDGRTLFHKKDPTRQLVTWELRTDAEPPVEGLELGKTPFPLPFGQRKEAVLKQFEASLSKKEQDADKEKRSVLVLVPKKNTEMSRDYVRVLLWIDAKQAIPTRVRLYDTSENVTTVDFVEVEVNKPIAAKSFVRPDVPQDWEIVPHPKESGGPRPATPEGKATGTK